MSTQLPPPEQCVALLRFLADDIETWITDERGKRDETPCQRIRKTAQLPGEFKRRVVARREASEFYEDHEEEGERQGALECRPKRPRPGR